MLLEGEPKLVAGPNIPPTAILLLYALSIFMIIAIKSPKLLSSTGDNYINSFRISTRAIRPSSRSRHLGTLLSWDYRISFRALSVTDAQPL